MSTTPPRSPVPQEVSAELRRVTERWHQLLLDTALARMPLARALLDHAADHVPEEVERVVDDRDHDARGSGVVAGEGSVPGGEDDLDEPEDPDDERVDREEIELSVPIDHLANLQNEGEHRSLFRRSRW